jgi:SPOR domain
MAAPIDTPLTGEIWHLSIDDLLAPLAEMARLGGPGPFVISLSASSAPVALPVKSMAGCQHAHVYQIQRTEDRRVRYRLRLGPFATEDEADAVLAKVRDIYPSALTATADADDLKAIANWQAKLPQAPAEKLAEKTPENLTASPVSLPSTPTAAPSQPVVAKGPVTAKGPPAAVQAAKPSASTMATAMASTMATAILPVLTMDQKVPARGPAPTSPQTPAAKPGGSAVPTVISPPVLTSAQKVPVRTPAMQKMPVRTPAMQKIPAPAAPTPAPSAPPARQVQQLSERLANLESTQTIRALTQLELEDDNASRWFVIQLSLSEDAFDPDTVPNLDIFSVYRLYSVAGIDQGRIMHALRLGFFGEEMAASAVASYLGAYYDRPSIKRVSAAERDRFAEQPLEPRKDIGATGKHSVIEITSERFVREKRSSQGNTK